MIGGAGSGPGQFATSVWGVEVFADSGWIFVGDHGNHRVQKFDLQGNYLGEVGSGPGTGDGEFAALHGGPNVRPEAEAVPAISLYNGFSPIYRRAQDTQPHWLIHHGHGRFGVVGPDPRQGLWHEDVGYDTPDRIGFIDVDGDGSMEVGYALRNSEVFRCRDLWTGDTRWEIELPAAPSGPVLTADVDGDGQPDLVSTNRSVVTVHPNPGDGTFRVSATYPSGMGPWGVAAGDFDADGNVDIVTSNYDGDSVSVLRGKGDGTFGAPAYYPFVNNYDPYDIEIADYDQDGDNDVAALPYSGSAQAFYIYANNGDGTLAAPVTVGPRDSGPVALDPLVPAEAQRPPASRAATRSRASCRTSGSRPATVSSPTPRRSYARIADRRTGCCSPPTSTAATHR